MICCCPNCDSLVPMNQELALNFNSKQQVCPCCELPFNPFEDEETLDLKTEETKNNLFIDKDLQSFGS